MGDDIWTVEALKQYVDQIFVEHARAIDVADSAMNHRLDTMNEFRGLVESERTSYVTFSLYDQRHEVLAAAITAERRERESRFRSIEVWQGKIIGAIALCAFVIPIVTGAAVYLITHHA